MEANNILQRPDISQMMRTAADICRRFDFASIEIPILFMAIQQTNRQELDGFLSALHVNPVEVYKKTANALNSLPRISNNTASLKIAQNLLKAFDTMVVIEQQVRSSVHPHYPLLVALIMIPGPLHDLCRSMGITTEKMQQVIAPQQQTAPRTEQPRPSGSTRDDQNIPTIKSNCVDLVERARTGEIKPAIGREEELKRVLQILSLYTKSNPILVGEPGTGKTAIVEGLAYQLSQGTVPSALSRLRLFQLDPSSISDENVMRSIIEEAKGNPNVVLFIDEIHTLISACSCSNNSLANLLKPEMARGTIKIMGATTLDEYTKHIEQDKAFERRFQKVIVDEPSIEASIAILQGIKQRFENHHHVTISADAVESAVKLSHRFITDRKLPDKAIDLLDEASSMVRMAGGHQVNDKNIMEVVTKRTGIPMQNLNPDDIERLSHIEEHLHKSVVGQDKAINAVANSIRRSRLGFADANRPIGSFLFLGTSGVGKTELCKALAEMLFFSRDAMVRIDMSELQLEHSVARLIGAPPGFIGYEKGGQLTEHVRHKPYSLVLFDEMEKAHPKVFELLLQLLDDGRLTDGQGRTVDFRNTIIVMTSNMGQDIIARNLAGTTVSDEAIDQTKREVVQLLKQRAAPEFWGRIDNVIMFLPLTPTEILQITQMQVTAAAKRMMSQGINVSFTPDVVPFIAHRAYQPEYGARHVSKVINALLVDQLANALMANRIVKGRPILCATNGDTLTFTNT